MTTNKATYYKAKLSALREAIDKTVEELEQDEKNASETPRQRRNLRAQREAEIEMNILLGTVRKPSGLRKKN
jgi:hypothetical protein